MKKLIKFDNGNTAVIDGNLQGITVESNVASIQEEYDLESLDQKEIDALKGNPNVLTKKVKSLIIKRKDKDLA